MSFTAFGRGCEQNGSSSEVDAANHCHGHTGPNPSHHSDANTNGNGTGNGNGNSNSNGSGNRLPFFGATLSSGVSIRGTVKFRSELVMDRDFEGTIESVGRLTVGRNGRVRGD